jgi:hypothetical protein
MSRDTNPLNEAKQLAQEVADRANYLLVGKLATAVLRLCQAIEEKAESPRRRRRASRGGNDNGDGGVP